MKALLLLFARAVLTLLAVVSACAVRAESVFLIDNAATGIYSVDISTGGPPTQLVALNNTNGSGYNATLATRPSDGMLFWMDGITTAGRLWQWNPSNPSVAPVALGTPGITNVLRLGFDALGRLLAIDQGSTGVWVLDQSTGAVLTTMALTGAVPGSAGGDLCVNPVNNVLYMVALRSVYTVSSTGTSTLVGALTGLGSDMTGCAFTANGSLLVSAGSPGQIYTANLGTLVATALPSSPGFNQIGDLASAPNAPPADLVVTKTAANSTPGSAASFTVTVKNNGPGFSTDVRVLDTTPTGLTFVSATPSQGVYSATAVTVGANTYPAGTWRVGRLAAGASATLVVNYTVNATPPASITNTAKVSYADAYDPVTSNNSASATITPSPDLQITKAGPATLVSPSATNQNYTMTVTNAGRVATTATYTVTDVLPAGLTYVNATGTGWTCSYTAATRTVKCDRTTSIAAGGSAAVLTVTVSVDAGVTGSITNTASVSSSGEPASNVGADNSDSVTSPVCASTGCVALTKATSPNPIGVGETSTLTFTIANGGATNATGLGFTDTLPANVTSPTGTFGGTCASSRGSTLVRNYLTGPPRIVVGGVAVSAGQSCTVTIAVTSTVAGSYANTSSNISGLAGGLSAAGVADTLVVQQSTLAKTFTPATIAVGSTSNMTFSVTNTSDAPAMKNIAFTENLPAGLTLVAAPTSPQCGGTVTGTAGGSTLAVSGASLAQGQAGCTIQANVTSTTTGTYNNQTTNVTGVSANLVNNAAASLTVQSGMSVKKVVNKIVCDPVNLNGTVAPGNVPPKAIPGAFVQFAITITNTSPAGSGATLLTTLTDALDANLKADVDLITGATKCDTRANGGVATSGAGLGVGISFAPGPGNSRPSFPATTTIKYFAPSAFDNTQLVVSTSDWATQLPMEGLYNAGELKPGDAVTLIFNGIVR